jgi:hypothetical protein
MFKIRPACVVIVALVLAAGSCAAPAATTPRTGTNQAPPVTTVRFSADIQPVFNASCVACHQGASAGGGMTLENGRAFAGIVNQPSSQAAMARVAPYNPDNSYLVRKLEDTHIQAGGSGARMPLNANPLPAAQIDLVRRWISLGAPNN